MLRAGLTHMHSLCLSMLLSNLKGFANAEVFVGSGYGGALQSQ